LFFSALNFNFFRRKDNLQFFFYIKNVDLVVDVDTEVNISDTLYASSRQTSPI
jgi:hypothetical protein